MPRVDPIRRGVILFVGFFLIFLISQAIPKHFPANERLAKSAFTHWLIAKHGARNVDVRAETLTDWGVGGIPKMGGARSGYTTYEIRAAFANDHGQYVATGHVRLQPTDENAEAFSIFDYREEAQPYTIDRRIRTSSTNDSKSPPSNR